MEYTHFLSAGRVAIFLFHGVIEKSDYEVRNYTRKHLEKEYFDRVLQALSRAGTPLAMQDVVAHRRALEPCPPHSFVVTFDDGFENNHSIAAPMLADLSIPATFYLSTAFVEHNSMSWIDRIEYCLEHVPRMSLKFPWDSATHHFHDWPSKINLLDFLRATVKKRQSIDLEELVGEVFSQCGLSPVQSSDDPLDRKLNWGQASQMAAHPLFTIGGHSHNHLNLAFLTADQVEQEISESFRLLSERASIQTEHYSYPEGLDYCYSAEIIEALKRHGVTCCPTAIEGTNDVRTDLFHLRRIMVV
jgi:peptidoglycan/xylan/chitin deacetylase (PgdA/CDA1 family)